MRSVCHRVLDEQDEGSIMTKWDELISRYDYRVDEDCVLRSQFSDGKWVSPRVYGGILGGVLFSHDVRPTFQIPKALTCAPWL